MRVFPNCGLYVITDSERLDFPTLYRKTEAILQAGVPVLQYRDKPAAPALRRERARALLELCQQFGTLLLVNDDVPLARAIGAAGAHIGQDDISCNEARRILGDQAIIGVSCYNRLDPALKAQAQGADYIAFGAFFNTLTKPGAIPADLDLLRRAQRAVTAPIVAIGGITPENGGALVKAGADLLAVASSIYASPNPAQVVVQFNALFH